MNVPAARTILLAGASGLIGRALQRSLRAQGCAVRRLVRGGGVGRVDEIPWDPAAGKLDPAAPRSYTAG